MADSFGASLNTIFFFWLILFWISGSFEPDIRLNFQSVTLYFLAQSDIVFILHDFQMGGGGGRIQISLTNH